MDIDPNFLRKNAPGFITRFFGKPGGIGPKLLVGALEHPVIPGAALGALSGAGLGAAGAKYSDGDVGYGALLGSGIGGLTGGITAVGALAALKKRAPDFTKVINAIKSIASGELDYAGLQKLKTPTAFMQEEINRGLPWRQLPLNTEILVEHLNKLTAQRKKLMPTPAAQEALNVLTSGPESAIENIMKALRKPVTKSEIAGGLSTILGGSVAPFVAGVYSPEIKKYQDKLITNA